MQKKLHSILSAFQLVLFPAALAFPALFFGGIGKFSLFVSQLLIVTASAAMILRLGLFRHQTLGRDLRWAYGATVFFILFVAYAGFQVISGPAVFSGSLGSMAPFMTVDNIVQVLCYILFFYLALDYLTSRRRVDIVVITIALQLVFMIALGYYQEFSQGEKMAKMYGLIDMSRFGIYFSTFLNPNHYGAFMMLTSLLLAAPVLYYVKTAEIFRADKDFIRALLCALILVLGLFSAYHAEARAALIAEIIAVSAVFLLGASSRGVARTRIFLFFGAAATGIVVFAVFKKMSFATLQAGPLWQDMQGRLTIYREAFGIVRDHFWFGTGLGTSMYSSLLYQNTVAENYNWIHLYNHHLELLAEMGAVGYFLFLAPVLALVYHGAVRSVKSPSVWSRTYGISSIVALVTLAVFSLVDDYLTTPALAYYLLLYLAILMRCGTGVFMRLPVINPRRAEIIWTPRRAAFLVAGLLPLAFLANFVVTDYRAARYVAEAEGNPVVLRKSIALRPKNPEVWADLGDAHYRRALTAEGAAFQEEVRLSMAAYQKSIELMPVLARTRVQLGRVRILGGDRLGGFRDIEGSLKYSPYNRDAYVYAICFYLRISEETPWADERTYFRQRVAALITQTEKIGKPLKPDTIGYLKNFYPMPPDDYARLARFFQEALDKKI